MSSSLQNTHLGLHQATASAGIIKKGSTGGILFNLGLPGTSVWSERSLLGASLAPEPYLRNGWLLGDWWPVHTGQLRPPCCWSPVRVRYPRAPPDIAHSCTSGTARLTRVCIPASKLSCLAKVHFEWSYSASSSRIALMQPALGHLLYGHTYFGDKYMNTHHCSVSQGGIDMPQ